MREDQPGRLIRHLDILADRCPVWAADSERGYQVGRDEFNSPYMPDDDDYAYRCGWCACAQALEAQGSRGFPRAFGITMETYEVQFPLPSWVPQEFPPHRRIAV